MANTENHTKTFGGFFNGEISMPLILGDFIGKTPVPLPTISPLDVHVIWCKIWLFYPWLLPLAHMPSSCSNMAHKSPYWILFFIWPSMWKLYQGLVVASMYFSYIYLVLHCFKTIYANLVGEMYFDQDQLYHLHHDLGSLLIYGVITIQIGMARKSAKASTHGDYLQRRWGQRQVWSLRGWGERPRPMETC